MLTSDYHKSSYSNGGANTCVEAKLTDHVDVRDSQNPTQNPLDLPEGAWARFVASIH